MYANKSKFVFRHCVERRSAVVPSKSKENVGIYNALLLSPPQMS